MGRGTLGTTGFFAVAPGREGNPLMGGGGGTGIPMAHRQEGISYYDTYIGLRTNQMTLEEEEEGEREG